MPGNSRRDWGAQVANAASREKAAENAAAMEHQKLWLETFNAALSGGKSESAARKIANNTHGEEP